MVRWHTLELLNHAAWPPNCYLHRLVRLSQSEENFLAVLRQKARPGLQVFRLATASPLDRHRRADPVAITVLSPQFERDGVANIRHRIAQHPNLRGGAILQDEFLPSVVVDIGE